MLKTYVDANIINENTIIFAHSIAPIFICKFLVENKIKVKRLVFVCGFNNYLGIDKDYDAVNESMYFDNLTDVKNYCDDIICFHSDQGWQYQHQSYQQRLKNKGIRQSMPRKGNSMDNGLMENFFGILKTEMFYDQEDKYETLVDDLIKAIDEYIYYYNYDRIKVKLKGLSLVNYRLQSFN